MKKILGLDLGTNSIGWALVAEEEDKKEILGLGSRIIPMSQDILGKFDSGISISQTAERTRFRSVRRIRERHLLRRERLNRVLHLMKFLPEHYEQKIDFIDRLGKFLNETEPKLAWKEIEPNRFDFIFKTSFEEMVKEFKVNHPELFGLKGNGQDRKIPYDWTIYYLRKKALQAKIEKEELAWILFNFNQKRGYYQLRGEEEDTTEDKKEEVNSFKILEITEADTDKKNKDKKWFNILLENGWIYRSAFFSAPDWIGKTKEFIVTTEIDENGNVKKDKEGIEKRRLSILPSFEEIDKLSRTDQNKLYKKIKVKTEIEINKCQKTVGCYIYDSLLQNPTQKINGKLVRTIERDFYKQELKAILEKQKEFHSELNATKLYKACLEELYKCNESHRNSNANRDFTFLFLNDIIFYQRPLKSKKSLISNCKFEFRTFKDEKTGELKKDPIKCIAKSHPLYQELRLWKFIQDFRIFEREKMVDGKLKMDVDVTIDFLKTEEDYVLLFDWLNKTKEIKQETLFSSYFKIKKKKGEDKLPFRWNYVEDKEYPGNETRAQILNRLAKVNNVPENFLDKEKELSLWHILYSVEDKLDLEKAMKSFAKKHELGDDFDAIFKKFPPFKKEYGAYSEKAIKKLLPLMRKGKYWDESNIDEKTKIRIDKIITGEYDEKIRNRVREKAISLTDATHFKGLPEWLACYIVYDRHSETSELSKWETPKDIEWFLHPKNPEGFKHHSLRNPIVEQVVTETLRTVKDIWRQHGDFSEIHIELGREMKNPADKRKTMTDQINENENTNLRIKYLLAELANHDDVENVRPHSPSQQEILKIYEDGILNSGIEIPEDIAKIVKTNQPSKSDLIRYKLWLEQKYCSPYTGEMIPLGKLFTSAFEIEHVIPQSRYFDDSLSNKVICEAEVNKEKENALGYEFIKNNEGRIIDLSFGKKVKIFTITQYEDFVKHHYGSNKSRSKMKKLLMEDIPETFIERQLNDSRYISKVVKSLLSKIVREKEEQEATSKNVISCTGGVTAILKQDWGLNDVWNRIVSPRFERMNEMTKSNQFGQWTNKDGKRVFQTEMPLEFQKGFVKKRIDHRHHAMDALVIACATRSHINYLNNEHARQKDDKIRFELRNKLRRIEEIEIDKIENGIKIRKKIKVAKEFHKPWNTFTQDAQTALEGIVVSFKQNLRVINKTVNNFQSYKDENGQLRLDKNNNPVKGIRKQIKGESWAIRKPLHKETVAGIVNLRFIKSVNLTVAIDQWEMIVDKNLKTKIKQLINESFDKKKIIKYFAVQENKWMGNNIAKVDLYYFSNDKDILVASRVNLDNSFNEKKIGNITDTGIKQILLNHLNSQKYQDQKDEKGKTLTPETIAFSPEGIEEMNKNLIALNNEKFHSPIFKVRTYEPKGNKFNVGISGNKKNKNVEAAKGTNLYFAIYLDDEGNRNYETIPLNIIIERLKQGLKDVPEINEKGYKLVFHLSPNDLVYVPTKDEIENPNLINLKELGIKKRDRLFNVNDFSGITIYFTPNRFAKAIAPKELDTSFDAKLSKINGISIKDVCIKLKVDRLGNIVF